ncbi:hypothetical protein ACHAQH_009367 [Verticillium albo-atrum]
MEYIHEDTKVFSESKIVTNSGMDFKEHAIVMAQSGFAFKDNTFITNEALYNLSRALDRGWQTSFDISTRCMEFRKQSVSSKWTMVLIAFFERCKEHCLAAEADELPLAVDGIITRVLGGFDRTNPGGKELRTLGRPGLELLMQYATADQKSLGDETLTQLPKSNSDNLLALRKSIRDFFQANSIHSNPRLEFSPNQSTNGVEHVVVKQQAQIEILKADLREARELNKALKIIIGHEYSSIDDSGDSKSGEEENDNTGGEEPVSYVKLLTTLGRVSLERDELARQLQIKGAATEE